MGKVGVGLTQQDYLGDLPMGGVFSLSSSPTFSFKRYPQVFKL